MSLRVKKRSRATRWRGSHTHGRGGKKKARGSGHRGGFGMAGTGKRAKHKKSLIINLYGNDYFGKDKALRRGNLPRRMKTINLSEIVTKYDTKKEIDLKGCKVLGDGDVSEKFTIKASAFSQSAREKIEKAGGKAISLSEAKSEEAPKPVVSVVSKKVVVAKKKE